MALSEYKAKRNFEQTREPAGKTRPSKKAEVRLVKFVLQKHDATRLHYDFRLEVEGVLKSWAVPKGFPTSRGDKRLAVQVEDHPLEYADFEGTIPEGNYGAGTVMIWDRGTCEVLDVDPKHGLSDGKLHFVLKGSKLKGEWALVRMKSRGEAKPQWLLFKAREDTVPFTPAQENRSVATRRTLEDIAKSAGEVWHSDRRSARQSGKPRARTARRTKPLPGGHASVLPSQIEALPSSAPAFVEPMKASLTVDLPRGEDWIYEVKFDGIRAVAVKNGDEVMLLSRANNTLTEKYPNLADALQSLPVNSAVLDGEVVALDPEGRSSFQLLQSWHSTVRKPPLAYYVFDIIHCDGKDLRGLPLLERKEVARKLIEGLPQSIRFSPAIEGEPSRVIKEMQARGLEGLIAKQKLSKYLAGARSASWRKFKWTLEQEFVIGGYTRPQGSRSFFGALLVGYYAGEQLMFAGKVGTGFDDKRLKSLFASFQSLVRPECPFANLPEKRSGQFGGGLTASQMRPCTWLKPELVCQVRFAEWTRDNHLRQPAFIGMREDKHPREVTRESAEQLA